MSTVQIPFWLLLFFVVCAFGWLFPAPLALKKSPLKHPPLQEAPPQEHPQLAVTVGELLSKEPSYLSPAKTIASLTFPENSRPYPTEIAEQVNSAPPLHRQARMNEFVGVNVRWYGLLYDAREDVHHKSKVSVCLRDRGEGPMIFTEVEKEANPDLKTARSGAPYWISGQIAAGSSPFSFYIAEPVLVPSQHEPLHSDSPKLGNVPVP